MIVGAAFLFTYRSGMFGLPGSGSGGGSGGGIGVLRLVALIFVDFVFGRRRRSRFSWGDIMLALHMDAQHIDVAIRLVGPRTAELALPSTKWICMGTVSEAK